MLNSLVGKEKDWKHVHIDHENDTVSFKLMTEPASKGGLGCQHYDMVKVSLEVLKYLNSKYPCRENSLSITKLEEALMWQDARTKDREVRGVEGKNEL